MFCCLRHSKLLTIGVELEKDRFEGPEMRKVNNIEKFTSQVLLASQEMLHCTAKPVGA